MTLCVTVDAERPWRHSHVQYEAVVDVHHEQRRGHGDDVDQELAAIASAYSQRER